MFLIELSEQLVDELLFSEPVGKCGRSAAGCTEPERIFIAAVDTCHESGKHRISGADGVLHASGADSASVDNAVLIEVFIKLDFPTF